MDAEIRDIWSKAGFCVAQKLPADWDEASSIDLIWLGESTAISARTMKQSIEGLYRFYPKLFFLHSSAVAFRPAHWQTYAVRTVRTNDTDWIVGSKLEEPLPQSVADYLAQQKTADLAAVVYMVLLESVFRENAEWCGHMSSVVGRM
jgi:phage terminase large subunit